MRQERHRLACKAWPTPFTQQCVGLCDTLFSAAPLQVDLTCLHGNKVRGVQPELRVKVYDTSGSSREDHMLTSVYRDTPDTPLASSSPGEGLLVNPVCRLTKDVTQNPVTQSCHTSPPGSKFVTGRSTGPLQGQRLTCFTAALRLVTSPPRIVSSINYDQIISVSVTLNIHHEPSQVVFLQRYATTTTWDTPTQCL